MNVTMICLGKTGGAKHYGGLTARMLEVLFTGRYAAKEVIQILEDEYEICSRTYHAKDDCLKMCNLSQGILKKAWKRHGARHRAGHGEGAWKRVHGEGVSHKASSGAQTGAAAKHLQPDGNHSAGLRSVMTAMKIPAADQPKYLKLLSLPQ